MQYQYVFGDIIESVFMVICLTRSHSHTKIFAKCDKKQNLAAERFFLIWENYNFIKRKTNKLKLFCAYNFISCENIHWTPKLFIK